MQLSSDRFVNSLVGKNGSEDSMEVYAETYLTSIKKLLRRHKMMRGGVLREPRFFGQDLMAVGSNNAVNLQQFSGNRY